MAIQNTDARAIVSLLTDSDPQIASTMRNKLLQMGEDRVADLLGQLSPEEPAHREVSRLLHVLRSPSVEDRIGILLSVPEEQVDLEAGIFALACVGYPDLDAKPYQARLDQLASELAPNVDPLDHPVRVVRTINDCLFKEQGYRGQPDYDRFPDPDDSYLNRVMDRKIGLPIALAVVYLLLARRLDLPIVGVNMPMHFILKYETEQSFYIDPYHAGQILTANECCALLGKPTDVALLPNSTTREILARTAANLFRTYTVLGDTALAETVKRLIDLLSPS